MDRVECIVIGAGVVGLAVARALALRGREVIVLERHDVIGSEVSSRNSGVIHAGLYYSNGSLKARACVTGKHALYDFCASHGVAHARTGKLVVATEDEQLDAMDALIERARGNGVEDLVRLDPQEARELEPEVDCAGALPLAVDRHHRCSRVHACTRRRRGGARRGGGARESLPWRRGA